MFPQKEHVPQQYWHRKLNEFFGLTAHGFRGFKKDFDRMGEKAECYVRCHPRKSMMISAGIGAAFGFIATCLLKRKKKY